MKPKIQPHLVEFLNFNSIGDVEKIVSRARRGEDENADVKSLFNAVGNMGGSPTFFVELVTIKFDEVLIFPAR